MKLPQQRFLRLLCRQPLFHLSRSQHIHTDAHIHTGNHNSPVCSRGSITRVIIMLRCLCRNAFHVSFRSLCHFQQIWGSWMCYCCEAWLIAAGTSESSCTHMHQLRAIWSQLIRAGKIPQKTGLCFMRNGGSCVLHVGLVCAYKSTHALQGLDPDHRQT